MTIAFTGKAGVSTFRAIAIKGAIKLYRDTGIKASRNYTPKNMIAAASEITGKVLKPRDYTGAIEALEAWIKENGACHD
jgi:hypothetical protein